MILMVALALLQVGILARNQLIIADAARAGAREASVNPDPAQVAAVVAEAATAFDPEAITVGLSGPGGLGSPIAVAVSYRMPVSVPFVGWLFPDDISLTSTVTMRREVP